MTLWLKQTDRKEFAKAFVHALDQLVAPTNAAQQQKLLLTKTFPQN
jgi:hypothetical protein